MARILVVDDRPTNRQLLCALLRYHRHELIEAGNGALALESVRRDAPDLVITDIMMPVMDGYEFTRQVRADPKIAAMPIIFYTATFRAPEARTMAAICNVKTVLPKPCDPQALLYAVNTELGIETPAPQGNAMAPKQSEIAEFRRLDTKLAWYADELNTAKGAFDGLLGQMSGLMAERDSLRALSERFSENIAGLQRFSARLTALIELTLEVSPEQGAGRVVQMFFEGACRLMKGKQCAIAFLDEAGEVPKHLFVKGIDPTIYATDRALHAGLPGTLAVRNGDGPSTVRRQNVAAADLPPGHPPVGDFLGAVIASRDWVCGWMYFANRTDGQLFSEEDEHIAGALASELAIFYENAVLYDLMQKHAAELQTEVVRRKKAEEESSERNRMLNQAQKMEAVGQLTGGIAHDFNNLLTVVKANAEDLIDDLKDNPGSRRQASLVLQAADRGADLVRQLLAFSRKQTLKAEVVNLNMLVEGFARLLQRTLPANIAISIAKHPNLPLIHADPGNMENALLNLCINARDAMPDGGTLLIKTDVADLPAESGDGEQRFVAISIADDGTGMTPEVIERAFDPFFTTKEVGKGTGLGLSMVYGFVQQSGGRAKIDSELGKGTTITFFLPLANTETQDKSAGLSASGQDQSAEPMPSRRILLVEDDQLVRESLMSRLERMGHKIVPATTAFEALSIMQRGEKFDLVFTDIIMPGALTGADLAREILKQWPGTRVLATSGYTENTLLGKVQVPEGVRLLTKPYSSADLKEAIATALK